MEGKPRVPRLRFPEFHDAPDWVEEPFSRLYRFAPTYTFSRDQLNYTSGSVKNIHYGDIHTRFQVLFDIRREIVPFITPAYLQGEPSPTSLCSEGDMVFADASEDVADVGKSIEIIALDGQQVVAGTHTILAKRRGSHLRIGFGGHLFRSSRIRTRIQKESQGAKVLGISPGRLSSVPVSFPTDHVEQQEIAECLTSLDELIAAEGRKLEALRTSKKGLMQDLFPREGETTPLIRFPEFRDVGDWEKSSLGEVCRFVRGPFGGALKKELFVREGFAVYEQSHAIENQMRHFRYFITEEKYEEMRRFAVQPNDIIMSCSGTMGRFAHLPEVPVPGVINQALLKLTVQDGWNARFVLLVLELPTTQSKLLSQSAGGAIKNVVGVTELKEIGILMPGEAEQDKIADCLASLDALVTAQTKKLDSLKLHKQGLMQGLFPSAEETKA